MPAHVEVRCYAGLAALAGAPEQRVPVGHPRSVKDVVESVGVPHVEVGLLVLDGVAVGFEHRVAGGERIAVYPPFTRIGPDATTRLFPAPPEPRRFVLDVHLGTLARRLRWLGFDTWWDNDADDASLLERSVGDGRILLSRDRGLLMRRRLVHGYCPRADDPELQLLEIVDRYDLATRVRAGSRCIRCNGMLEAVDKRTVLDRLPPRVRTDQQRFRRCRGCGQVYWPGTHLTHLDGVTDHARRASPADGRPSPGL